MIKADSISFAYLDVPVLKGTSFTVGKNQKVGIVGPNGAGKSTLLKIILGIESIFEGKLEVVGNIGYVPQEIKRDPILEKANTVKDYLDPKQIHNDFELIKFLSNLELERVSLNASPVLLSGGQKTKLALARALLSEPDILLLDEPTNFMDTKGREWVMDFLSKYPKTLILISHDLELMDKYIDKILYLNIHSKQIEEYKGNYKAFLKLKKEKEDLLKRKATIQQKHVKALKESVTRLMSNTSKKGVRARVIMQRRLDREIEKLPELPKEIRSIRLNLPDPSWIGELVLKAEDLEKSFGNTQVLNKVSFSILRGQKIALIGSNGVGKSTLIKSIMGVHEIDSGTIRKGDGLNIGYYSQEFDDIALDKTLLELFQEKAVMSELQIRSLLSKFMFTDNKIYQKIESLSGGEKTRLSIALLLLSKHNLLILDEPTTYLDLVSQRVILDALKEYKGAMLVVSHTPDFIKELSPDKALLLPENRFTIWDDSLLEKISEV